MQPYFRSQELYSLEREKEKTTKDNRHTCHHFIIADFNSPPHQSDHVWLQSCMAQEKGSWQQSSMSPKSTVLLHKPFSQVPHAHYTSHTNFLFHLNQMQIYCKSLPIVIIIIGNFVSCLLMTTWCLYRF